MLQGVIQRAFASVAEGRMADVVHQCQRFGEVFVESKRSCDGARDLRHFHRVRQAAAEVIGVAMGKDLRLAGEAAKGARMNDASAIALKG